MYAVASFMQLFQILMINFLLRLKQDAPPIITLNKYVDRIMIKSIVGSHLHHSYVFMRFGIPVDERHERILRRIVQVFIISYEDWGISGAQIKNQLFINGFSAMSEGHIWIKFYSGINKINLANG